jgi:hypothetical protein
MLDLTPIEIPVTRLRPGRLLVSLLVLFAVCAVAIAAGLTLAYGMFIVPVTGTGDCVFLEPCDSQTIGR